MVLIPIILIQLRGGRIMVCCQARLKVTKIPISTHKPSTGTPAYNIRYESTSRRIMVQDQPWTKNKNVTEN
jgi:hypothetical protein